MPHEHDEKPCCGHKHVAKSDIENEALPAGEKSRLGDIESKPAVRTEPIGFEGGVRRTALRIEGMDCADEVDILERALKPLPGVRAVDANIMAAKITVTHDPAIDTRQLIAAIEQTGLKARSAETESREAATAAGQRARWTSVVLSGAFTGAGLVLHWFHLAPEGVRIAAFAIAIITGGWFIFPKALTALRSARLDMNVLMSVAAMGAVFIGEWPEAAAVVFLFALSELLEAFSVQRARKAIQSLMHLAPETALVRRNEDFVEVAAADVKAGEVVAVKSGARVPLDGTVVVGTSAVNQAPITGESMPVEKKVGDQVFAGTINGEGSLEVKVTKAANDTMLARIIHLVEEAQSQKASSQRFVDVFAKYYTPSVMVLAVLVFLVPPLVSGGNWSVWFYRALVLLVIACPCALVISTPVSIVSGLTAMARRGVLVKGGAFLEAIGKLRALAVDKTGTITEGRPQVTKVVPVSAQDDTEILRIAAAIDSHSDHPLAQAVVAFAKGQGIQLPRATHYRAHTGRGAEGVLDGHVYFVGNHRFAHELGVCSEQLESSLADIESEALSVVVVGHKPHDDCKGDVAGILAVGDSVRANAAAAVRSLHNIGVEKVVMLSGDNQKTVNAIAKQVGIDEADGDLLPDQKIERVRELLREHGSVGMVGDGVNDAPAMAAATVGIAMGAAGTDTAIETADLALMQDDLSKVAEAVALGRRTLRVIQFNISFSIAIKAVFLVLTLFGYASLWLAIAADTGATLLVTVNALRLLRHGFADNR